jgi:hypothetical protein
MSCAIQQNYLVPSTTAGTTVRTDEVMSSVKVGFWRRVAESVVNWQHEQRDREIANFLQAQGGRLTDENERQLLRVATRFQR